MSLKSDIVYKEISCSSISNLKHSNKDIDTYFLSFSVGRKDYNFQTSNKENIFSLKQAVCRGQFIEKWKKR